MPYSIEYTESSLGDIRYFKKYEQVIILEAIDQQLLHQPLTHVRNRKPLDPNNLGDWELRVGKYRIFYSVESVDMIVVIRAVGWKEHNTLYIRGKEYKL